MRALGKLLETLEALIDNQKIRLGQPFKKSDLDKWFADMRIAYPETNAIFRNFRDLAERGSDISFDGENVFHITVSGNKKGTKYQIVRGARTAHVIPLDTAKSGRSNTSDPNARKADKSLSNKAIEISTTEMLNNFLRQYDLTIGGPIVNAENLHVLRTPDDLLDFPNTEGCYMIFSTLTESEIPCFNDDLYKCYKTSIVKNGSQFRCLYNGKHNGVRGRLREHLFSERTISKALDPQGMHPKLSGTGAMSLEGMSKEEAQMLTELGQFDETVMNLKTVKTSNYRPESNNKYAGKEFLLNGINIQESQWSSSRWAVCVITTELELGKILIEGAFALRNGYPPLCRRHG